LRSEPTIHATAIDITVNDGVVTLEGDVDSAGEQWLIETATQRIAGIRRLSSQLKIIMTNPGLHADSDISRNCEDALSNVIPQFGFPILVRVSHGWVTLTGDVTWGYERWIAETAVSDLPGVCGVNCQIKVKPGLHYDEVDALIQAAMSPY